MTGGCSCVFEARTAFSTNNTRDRAIFLPREERRGGKEAGEEGGGQERREGDRRGGREAGEVRGRERSRDP